MAARRLQKLSRTCWSHTSCRLTAPTTAWSPYVIAHSLSWLPCCITFRKEKGKNTPFCVNFMRSQALYQAAQVHDFHCKLMASSTKPSPYFITAPGLGCRCICPSFVTALSQYVISPSCFGCFRVCRSLQIDKYDLCTVAHLFHVLETACPSQPTAL